MLSHAMRKMKVGECLVLLKSVFGFTNMTRLIADLMMRLLYWKDNNNKSIERSEEVAST
jgi:hypothetical protein